MIHVSHVIQFYKSIHRILRWLTGHHVKMCCSRVVLIIILRYVEPYDDWSYVNTLSKHSGMVWCVDFNVQGDKFVSCSDDLSVVVC